jgi:hypothetical protein
MEVKEREGRTTDERRPFDEDVAEHRLASFKTARMCKRCHGVGELGAWMYQT